MSNTPAGWYDDGQGAQRWWDGTQWTEHTQPAAGSEPAAPSAPQSPSAPQAPGHDMPTQVAPNRASDYGQQPEHGAPQQPGYGAPQQPGYGGQQAYGSAGGGYGAPQQFGAPPSGGKKGKGLLIGIIAGVAVLLVLCLVGGFFVLRGGSGPKDVAEDYLAASADGDFEEVCNLSSEKAQDALFEGTSATECSEIEDAFEEQSGDLPDGQSLEDIFGDLEVDYEVGDATEDGDEATVEYTIEVTYTGDDEEFGSFFEQEKSDEEMTLVKEDGDWKVDSADGML